MANNALTNEEILKKVKSALGVTGDYLNETLTIYIDEVKSFLSFAGVSESTINSGVSVGVICRGVADLWNYGAGNAQLSDYFKQRVTQLALSETNTDVEEAVDEIIELQESYIGGGE